MKWHLAMCALSLAASCADSTSDTPGPEDASVLPITDAGTPDATTDADARVDASVVTCDAAAFCPFPSGVDARFILTAVWGSGASDVWAVGSGGTIVRFDGTAWHVAASGVPDTLSAVWGSSASDIWVVASPNVLLHSSGMQSGVATFTKVPALPATVYNGRAHAVWGTNPTDVMVGTASFVDYDLDTGEQRGGNWLQRTSKDGGAWDLKAGQDGAWTNATVRAIWGSAANDVWLSADNSEETPFMRGMLLHRGAGDAGPGAWVAVDSQSAQAFDAIWGSSGSDVWAVGAAGTIRHHAAGDARWTIVTSPTTQNLHAVWGSAASDVWAVGDEGTVIHFDGTSWSLASIALPIGPKPNLYGVWGSGANDVWIVGDGITLRKEKAK